MRGELDNLWGEIDHIWEFIVAEHEHEHNHDYDYDYDADYEEDHEHDHEMECNALKGFLFRLGQSADTDETFGISLNELQDALGFVMMSDHELAGVLGMIWGWTDTNQDGKIEREELEGLRALMGDEISAEDWGTLEAAFAFADASGNQNEVVSLEEMMDMLKGMRDSINGMGGVEGVFDILDSMEADGNISGMEYE